MLRQLLHTLSRQDTRALFDYSVIVIDNDAAGSARACVEQARQELAMDIAYEVEPTNTIPAARNHALRIATGNYIGIIDDDEIAPADWLTTPGVDSFAFYSTFSNFRAHDYDALAGKYCYLTKLAHDAGKKMLLPVHPGHDNSHSRDDPYVMPLRDGQTLRDFLRAATDAGADYIMVTSWNEWPESTVVEPSSSWADPYLCLKILAEWKGIHFHPPPLPVNSK